MSPYDQVNQLIHYRLDYMRTGTKNNMNIRNTRYRIMDDDLPCVVVHRFLEYRPGKYLGLAAVQVTEI